MQIEPDHDASFIDAELKAAVARVHGPHRVRADLRARIVQKLDADRGAFNTASSPDGPISARLHSATPSRMAILRSPWRLALAASVLIVASAGTMYWRHELHEAAERQEYSDANRALLEAMVDAHIKGVFPDPLNLIDAPLTDPTAVAAQFAQKLGRFVPPVSLAGWTIDSASICQIGKLDAACVRLRRGTTFMTVLSLPASAFKMEEDYEDYDFLVKGYPVAGFAQQGGVHCLVVDKSLSESDAVAIRDQIKRS